ncbi:MAG: undecaprenyldiphospho-muramoylpentapeptide beta-N-acetylglucosaminyltransferase [Candidatus Stahlbacteria bacterium]|nr:undecaprenyldiphospho-muramoylpentapeptide beta-N-acetylglucosaminyltransferase [Candidatus Stahlbacteria bacterium]
MKIIISTGGTGGHIFPGLAIAEELEAQGVEVIIVGSKFGMESRILRDKLQTAGKDRYTLKLTCQKALLGKSRNEKLKFPVFLCLSFFQSILLLLKERPDGVIGTGGFGSFSIVFMAALAGLPTIITEVDSIPGLTTKILSRFVHEVWIAFEDAKADLPALKVKVSGFPVRKGIRKANKSIRDFGLESQKPTILVFGGSRGARRINEVVKEAISYMPEYRFIWQTGETGDGGQNSKSQIPNPKGENPKGENPKSQIPNPNRILNTDNRTPNVWRAGFIEDMGSAYGNADIVVARAGALTIGELAAVGLPAILIPYPYAAGGHQLVNARILEKKGAAVVILEKDLTPSVLAERIKGLIEDKKLRYKMGLAIKEFSHLEAANLIANRMITLCKRR